MHLREACAEVMSDKAVTAKYREQGGMTSADVLNEIRGKHGADAFGLCSILDVHDEMSALFGKPTGRRA